MAELEQFAANAHLAPQGVLPRQPQHQLLALGGQRRPPGTLATAESGPAPPDQRAVPAQDCGRSHQEQGARRKLTAERGLDYAIGPPPKRPSSGASPDGQLLTEDEQFEIAIRGRATPNDEQVNQQAEEGIEQGQQHRAASVGRAELPVKPLAVACRRISARLGGACPTAGAVTIRCAPRADRSLSTRGWPAAPRASTLWRRQRGPGGVAKSSEQALEEVDLEAGSSDSGGVAGMAAESVLSARLLAALPVPLPPRCAPERLTDLSGWCGLTEEARSERPWEGRSRS